MISEAACERPLACNCSQISGRREGPLSTVHFSVMDILSVDGRVTEVVWHCGAEGLGILSAFS